MPSLSKKTCVFLMWILFLPFVTACGGGGGGGDGSIFGNGSDSGDDNGAVQAGSFAGTITASRTSAVDSDINDPLAPFQSNDDFDSAQALPANVQLNGYVTFSATGDPQQLNDRFATDTDPIDMFSVRLNAGQYVSLTIADWNDGLNNIDLDLYKIDNDTPTLELWSHDSDNDESVQIATDGDYVIAVSAIGGASKYLLNIGSVSIASNHYSGNSINFIAGELIVKYRAPAQPNTLQTLTSSHGETKKKTARAKLLKLENQSQYRNALSSAQTSPYGYLAQLNPQSYQKLETLKALDKLRADPGVEYAEPNYIRKAMRVPNDSGYPFQWHYPQINLPQAWDITIGSSSVIVGVIDTGVWLNHEDLSGQLVAGYDFISDVSNALDGNGIDADPNDPGDGNGPPGSSSWHGTHVAGTIAARTNNGSGVAGVGWNTRVMPLRALGGEGGSSFDIIQAARYAARLSNDSGTLPAQAVDVLNLSLGGPDSSSAEEQAFAEVRNAGVIIVAAAGNEHTGSLGYPASYSGVVSVSAVDLQGNFASTYSNFGPAIDVAAPGGELSGDFDGDGYNDGVLSTLVEEEGKTVSAYGFYEGTSMASPHVAGVIALMKAVYPGLTPAKFDSLLSTGQLTSDRGSIGRDDQYGHGLIDALKAVLVAQQEAGGNGKTVLYSDPNRIDFASNRNTQTITVTKIGSDSISVQSFSDSAAWLSVSAAGVDADGLGDYQLTVDRSGLSDGVYSATLSFEASDASLTIIAVTMQVGVLNSAGDAGFVYILLLDADTEELVDQQEMSARDGQYSYNFTGVDEGEYFILAGSDVDNDLIVCGVGESCGAYPSLGNLEILDASTGGSGLNFVVGMSNSGLASASSVNGAETDSKKDGVHRRQAWTEQAQPAPAREYR